MKISYYTVDGNLDTTNGYGNAGFQFIRSLQQQGHEVPFDDETAPIQVSFCQPNHYKFHEGQYKIGYTPWESTELPDGWLEKMNACDEVWATSEWVANVYREAGVSVPVNVVEHGLEEMWGRVRRFTGERVNFLHHGEPALRKGGQMALDAFRKAFGDRTDVHLTIKANSQHYLRAWHDGKFCVPEYNNVTIITGLYFKDELYKLYEINDCLVYPTYGEGFGLIPLQALGSGLPVISTYDWAPYKDFITLPVQATVNRSVWPVHPGNVYYPDFDDLVLCYKTFAANPQYFFDKSHATALDVQKEFDWARIAKKVETHLEKILESR